MTLNRVRKLVIWIGASMSSGWCFAAGWWPLGILIGYCCVTFQFNDALPINLRRN